MPLFRNRQKQASLSDLSAFKNRLERLGPYLPREPTTGTVGSFAALNVSGDAGIRLAAMAQNPVGQFGDALWNVCASYALPVAVSVIGPQIRLFGLNVADSARAAMITLGPHDPRRLEIIEVSNLFGPGVGFDTANRAWQNGYACALGLSVTDPGRRQALDTFVPGASVHLEGQARRLFNQPSASWLGIGLSDPFTEAVVVDVLRFVTGEEFRKLYPLVGPEGRDAYLTALFDIAAKGFAIGRLQLDPHFVRDSLGQ